MCVQGRCGGKVVVGVVPERSGSGDNCHLLLAGVCVGGHVVRGHQDNNLSSLQSVL